MRDCVELSLLRIRLPRVLVLILMLPHLLDVLLLGINPIKNLHGHGLLVQAIAVQRGLDHLAGCIRIRKLLIWQLLVAQVRMAVSCLSL